MADRPIIFSGPMVRALIENRKTQTRRIAKVSQIETPTVVETPYRPGDRLWVRERWRAREKYDRFPNKGPGPGSWVIYEADAPHEEGLGIGRVRPSIHMPRWASRLTLIVEEVRVQRLQDINEEDAIAEGAVDAEWGQWREDALNVGMPAGSRIENERDAFARLWNRVNSRKPDDPRAWRANPWVAALTFRVERANIDTL